MTGHQQLLGYNVSTTSNMAWICGQPGSKEKKKRVNGNGSGFLFVDVCVCMLGLCL